MEDKLERETKVSVANIRQVVLKQESLQMLIQGPAAPPEPTPKAAPPIYMQLTRKTVTLDNVTFNTWTLANPQSAKS